MKPKDRFVNERAAAVSLPTTFWLNAACAATCPSRNDDKRSQKGSGEVATEWVGGRLK
jgi:hypothetical protein